MSQHSGPIGPYPSEHMPPHPASAAPHGTPSPHLSAWGYRDPALDAADSIDSLADLFLGEITPSLGLVLPPHDLEPHHKEPTAPAAPAVTPVRNVAPAGDGRTPPPRPQMRVRPAAHLRGSFDPTGAAAPEIEALLVGNLPVLASAWVQQYAKHRASSLDGVVALVRSIDDQVSVDLIYPAGAVSPHAGGEEPGVVTSLEEALRRAAAVSARVVVRADRVDEQELAVSEADRVTILTACDDAAVVQCYRSLKLLAAARGEQVRPDLRVAILAATPQRSDEIAHRLSNACSAFLESRIEVEHCGQRMSASHTMRLFAGTSPLKPDVHMLVRAVRNALTGPTPPRAITEPRIVVRPINQVAPSHPRPQEPARAAEPSMAPSAPPVLRLASLHRTPHAASHPASAVATAQPSASSPAQPQPSHPEKATSRLTALAPSLAARMGTFEPLPIRCPQAPHIELALAPDGSLHLLAAEGSLAADTPSTPGLLTARAWALANYALLAMAFPALGFHASTPAAITLHVLTDRPKALRALLDTDIRIHLLAPLGSGDPSRIEGSLPPEPAWLCLELN